jgi:hypothetical protein
MVKEEPRLSRFEIVGAWLNIWTPPRDAHVPPVPWRKLAIWSAVTVVALGVAAAIAAPRIDAGKEKSAAAEKREFDAARARRNAQIRREQQPRFGTLTTTDPDVALTTVGVAIGRDARVRFSPKARTATCEPAGGTQTVGRRLAYNCISAVNDVVGAGSQKGARGVIGIPYRAVLDFDARRYAFCKTNPPPGEQVIQDPGKLIQLPRACRL